jgi:hypothetical protein
MRLSHTVLAAAATVAVLGLGGPAAVAAAAPAAAGTPAWQAVALPDLGSAVLEGLSALGPADAYAVGFATDDDPILLHWNGAAWSVQATPGLPDGVTLQDVDAFSDRDILADGTDTTTGETSVVYQFNGSSWSSLAPPSAADGGPAPYGASFGPGGQIWAQSWAGGLPTFFELTSAGWQTYPTGVTARGFTSDPLFVTPASAWSDGFTGLGTSADSPLLLHFNGTAWSQAPAPPLPSGDVSGTLSGLVALRFGSLTVSGNAQPCTFGEVCSSSPFVETGSGTAWTSQALPSGVLSVSGLSPGLTGQPQWIVARTSDASSSYYLHDSGGGTWTLVPGVAVAGETSPQMSVVHIPGTNATWAVGYAQDGSGLTSFAPRIELNGTLP